MGSTETPRLLRRLLPYLVAGLVLLLAAAVFSFRLLSPTESLEIPSPGRVVVLPVVNATGENDQDWVEVGLTEIIAETLRRTPGIEAVAPERLVEVLKSHGLETAGDAARRRVRELAFELGANLALDVLVRRPPLGTSYVLRLAVVERGGSSVATVEVEGADPMSAAQTLTLLVAEALARRAEPMRVERIYSPSPFLNRLVGMGLAELRRTGPEAARPYFEIALRARPEMLAAAFHLAECDRLAGRLPESRNRTIETLRAAQVRGESGWQRRSLHQLALLEGQEGRNGEARKLAARALSLATTDGDRSARLEVLGDLARFALADTARERAMEIYGELLDLEEELGDRLGRSATLTEVARVALTSGELDDAEARLEEARRLTGELGDVRGEIQVLASLGEVHSRRGKRQAAVEAWSRALEFYEQSGESSEQILLKRNVAETLLLDDDLDGAEGAFKDLHDLAVELGDLRMEALAAMRLTWVHLRRGYPFLARNHLERALALDENLREPLTLQRLIAWLAYEEGNYRLAIDTLSAVKRQAGEAWRAQDQEFLDVFVRAGEEGERLPLPGDDERQ